MTSVADIAVIIAFTLCALIAVAGALGMATTMSMFRSGIFLMASFIGVAGLFILLAADLMGLLQIMMYIGGMLVMILFMVLFMHDPGGAMMAAMPDMMAPVERFFSGGLQQDQKKAAGDHEHSAHGQGDASMHKHEGGHAHEHHHEQMDEDMDHDDMHHGDMNHGGMDMGGMNHGNTNDMSMVTPVRKLAAWTAAAIGAALAALVLLRPTWPLSAARPDPDSAVMVGRLLMGKYMVAFEGCGFLILMGIFGAVLLAHVRRQPADGGRGARVAQADPPPDIEPDTPASLQPSPPPEENRDGEHRHHMHGGQA